MPKFIEWFLGVVTTTGILSCIGYVFRGTLARFFSKAIEHRFEKRLESFKGELRDNEKELEQIRSFLVSARRDHDTALQAKKLEAAESLLKVRDGLAQFSILIEYIKTLNVEEILKCGDDPRVAEFIEMLLRPLNLDEKLKRLEMLDKTLPRLYLSAQSLDAFEVYQRIIMGAVMMLKLMSIPLKNRHELVQIGGLSKEVIKLVPASKDDFDKFGEAYAYHWATYFHDQILMSLRHEVSGRDDLAKATMSAESMALDSRRVQSNVRSMLEQKGLPKKLIADDVAASSTVEKTTIGKTTSGSHGAAAK